MTTTNDMIYKTLRTKADKPAKFADALREMGYKVENGKWNEYRGECVPRSYWSVNGLEVSKWVGDPAQLGIGRGRYIKKFENIKLIDFVDYFEKQEGRETKRKLMDAHDSIGQVHEYWKDERTHYFDADGNELSWYRYGCRKEARRHRRHRVIDRNYTIEEYKRLKNKAAAAGWGWSHQGEEDYEIDWAKSRLENAEKRVEKLWKELEAAEREVENRKRDVQREIDKKAEGERELDAWLKERGIRGEAA